MVLNCTLVAENYCPCIEFFYFCRNHSMEHFQSRGEHSLHKIRSSVQPDPRKVCISQLQSNKKLYLQLQEHCIKTSSELISCITQRLKEKLKKIQKSIEKINEKIESLMNIRESSSQDLIEFNNICKIQFSLSTDPLDIPGFSLQVKSILKKNKVIRQFAINFSELSKLNQPINLSEKIEIIQNELNLFTAPLVPFGNLEINTAKFFNQSPQLLFGSYDKKIYSYDYISGNFNFFLQGHTDEIRCIAITPNDKIAVSGSSDATCIVWDLREKVLRKRMAFWSSTIWDLAFTKDYQEFITVSADLSICVINLANFNLTCKLKGHSDEINAVVISNDSKFMYTGSDDKSIIAWNLSGYKQIFTLLGHTNTVLTLALDRNGIFLYSGSSDGTVYEWNTRTQVYSRTIYSGKDWVRSICLSEDLKTLIIGNYTGEVGRTSLVSPDYKILYYHYYGVKSVAISKDMKFIVSASFDSRVQLWDCINSRKTYTFGFNSSGISCISASASLELIAIAFLNPHISLINPHQNKILGNFSKHIGLITLIELDPATNYAISADKFQVLVWDLKSFNVLSTINIPNQIYEELLIVYPLLSKFSRRLRGIS